MSLQSTTKLMLKNIASKFGVAPIGLKYLKQILTINAELIIKEQRLRLQSLLDDSPSLKPHLISILDRIYKLAVIAAELETGLNTFPEICPFAITQILEE